MSKKKVVLAYSGGLDDQKDAAGFIRILSLPARAKVMNERKKNAVEVTK